MALPVLRLQDGLLRVVVDHARSGFAGDADWIDAAIARHTMPFSRPEFLKAVRALSARYVEHRSALPSRSPLDSAGKRAAFAGFYAPLHYLTIRGLLRALPHGPQSRVLDLGCGTGVGGLAWAASLPTAVPVTGVDLNTWALEELRWNSRHLAIPCRTQRGSMVDVLDKTLSGRRRQDLAGTGIVCAWSANELPGPLRDRLLTHLLDAHRAGASVLIVEPLALSAVPWWASWQAAVTSAGGSADEWRLAPDLPPALAELDEAAGFRRDALTVRSFWLEAA